MPNSTESDKILNDIDEFIKNANIEQANNVLDYVKHSVKYAKFQPEFNFYIMDIPNLRNMYSKDLFETVCEVLAKNSIMISEIDDYNSNLYIPTEFVKKNLQENLLKSIQKDF